ncbi:MFS transporter [Thalassobacillus sp. CUG 92003]|uniref:MFS transporter n=1 Tax=Thalassobacillus sp. CUG 92003 TaxID=2736641 RepID=UPI0015E6678A|nr:MFS transporter [Thalassobacillus sp. CUG 92003]
MEDKRLDLIALASIPIMMTLGNSMLIPVLPLIEKEIGITAFQSSLILSIYSFIAILLIPVSGYLSDIFGRKKIILPGLIIVAAGGALAAFAAWKIEEPYVLILVGRFLQGIGASGAFPVVLPTVGDMFKEEEQVSEGLGVVETANTFGKVISPIAGGLLALVVWFMPFIAVPILSLVSIILVFFFVKVPKNENQQSKQDFKSFLHCIKDIFHQNGRWLFAIFIIGCFLMFILFGFLFHFSSMLEDRFHMKGYMKGLLLAVPLLFLCIASYIGGKKIGSKKPLMKRLILFGSGGASIAFVWVKDDMALMMFLLLVTIASIGIGLALPCLDALITEGIEKEERGSITSLYSSMRFVGVAAGPPIIALVMKNNSEMIYLILAGVSAAIVVLALFLINTAKMKKSTS